MGAIFVGLHAFLDNEGLGQTRQKLVRMRQGHRPDRGDNQQTRHHLHGDIEVVDQSRSDLNRVGTFALDGTSCKAGGSRRTHNRQNRKGYGQSHGAGHGDHLGFTRGIDGLDADQHDHKQEQHHDGPGVDHNLYRSQELGPDTEVDRGNRHHHGHHVNRGVYSLARKGHCQGRHQRHRAHDGQENSLSG